MSGGSRSSSLKKEIAKHPPEIELTVDGNRRHPEANAQGYITLVEHWKVGQSLTLDLAIEPRLWTFHPAIDGLRGAAALQRGPEVFCIEGIDNQGID